MISLSTLRTSLLAALVMAPLLQSMNPAVAALGSVLLYALVLAITGVSVLHVLLSGRVRVPHAFAWSTFWFVLLIAWSLARVEGSAGLGLTVKWLAILVFFSTLVAWPLSSRDLERLVWVGGVAAMIAVSLGIFGGAEKIGRVAWFVHPNFVGGLLVVYAFFVLLGLSSARKSKRLFSWVALAVLIVGLTYSASRASMLAVLVVIVVLTARYYVSSRKIFISATYITVVSLGLSFLLLPLVFGPQALPQLPDLNQLTSDEQSLQLFGKRAETGRLDIWAGLFEYIEQRPLAGWGAGVTPEDLTGVIPESLTGNSLSAHNGYLQIWLQLGVVGMILQTLLFVTLLLFLFRRRNRVARVALAVLLGLILREMFEVTLLQNNAPLTILIWLIIGIGIGTRNVAARFPHTAPTRKGRKAAVEVMTR